jgi:CRISPR-associated endonuclease/helicase Cas3
MTPLDVGDFAAFFRAIHGKNPFPWQLRLLREVLDTGWPNLCDLPTASGKTAIIDIAVFAMALDSPELGRRMPRRTAFVVDRRLVVDDAFARAVLIAECLAAALAEPRSRGADGKVLKEVASRLAAMTGADGDSTPLQVAVLRGGLPRDNGWVESVSQPTIVLSTIDQVGSRLLFRGYGVSSGMAPVHAGLLGEDCLLVLDEAHLSAPFLQTLHAVGLHRARATDPLGLPFAVVTLSATPEKGKDSGRIFSLNMDRAAADRADAPLLDRRFTAAKRARLGRAPVGGGLEKQARAFVAYAKECLKRPDIRVVGVVVNRVRLARKVHDLLAHEFGEAGENPAAGGSVLLTGRCRPLARDMLLGLDRAHDSRDPFSRVIDRIRTGRDRIGQSPHRPMFVVGTQAIEAGADIDFDALVTEMAPWPSLRQRFGRLDRAGDLKATDAWIVCTFDLPAADPASQDRVYGTAGWNTRQWLWQICGGRAEDSGAPAGTVDCGIDGQITLGQAPAGTSPEARNAPRLSPSIMDLFAQTFPRPYPDPDPALWLHGPSAGPPDVQIVWRADAPANMDPKEWGAYAEVLAVMPPTSSEALPLPVWTARSWLSGVIADAADLETVDAAPPGRKAARAAAEDSVPPQVFVWAGSEASRLVRADRLAPGSTVILPSSAGGCDRFGWVPDVSSDVAAKTPTSDIAAVAILRARGRKVVRLHPNVLEVDVWVQAQATFRSFHGDASDSEVAASLLAILPELMHGLGQSPASVRYAGDDRLLDAGIVFIGRPQPRTRERLVHVRPDLLDDDDQAMLALGRVPLLTHCNGVEREAGTACRAVGLRSALLADTVLAARSHDFGKAETRFKALMWDEDVMAVIAKPPLAKSLVSPGARSRWAGAFDRAGLPPGARHECWSVVLLAGSPLLDQAFDPDLVLWLVGTHHGHGRPFFDPIDDPTPAVREIVLDVDADGSGRTIRLRAPVQHSLADASSGWADRFDRLIARYGHWGLAWLEAVVRLSDAKRSRSEAEMFQNGTGGLFADRRAA